MNNAAERLQVETSARAGLITARADYDATLKGNAAGLHNQLGQIAANRAGTIMTYDAGAQREQANLLAAYRNGVAGVQIGKQAQFGMIEADRSQANRGASNQTAREQQNNAADTQARTAGRAAAESTSMLDGAARIKLGGAEESIARVRAAGLQAAEWHRMAQVIGQVSHDITRRIEEMGQYHF